jgi:hypothetical protein
MNGIEWPNVVRVPFVFQRLNEVCGGRDAARTIVRQTIAKHREEVYEWAGVERESLPGPLQAWADEVTAAAYIVCNGEKQEAS